ncbi:protein kinase [Trypanosoma grayi]|uniref:protein kinase n=1 Tax=Trypanosoma grayi TaxID=71804 RepID=UPI0004F46FB0|nr:protein kinase [Trypanosoma grayi]KEG10856.1 protein kinase [Trypanosoma grayi]
MRGRRSLSRIHGAASDVSHMNTNVTDNTSTAAIRTTSSVMLSAPKSAVGRLSSRGFNGRSTPHAESDDDFDVRSANGDGEASRALSSGALSNAEEGVPNLATFYNKPQECYYCHSPAVTRMCEQCEDMYICDDCIFSDKFDHDPTHAISALYEMQSTVSRSFGSSIGTMEGGASSLFYDPCEVCGRVILDTELVYNCDDCNVVICGGCFQKSGASAHEHELRPFQRTLRSGASNSALVNKSRNSEGNKVINEYVVVRMLGRGSYAKVNLVQHRRAHTLYALKILRHNATNKAKRALLAKPGNEDVLLREIAVMKFVSHPNLVKLKEVIDDVEAQKVYVIMEYCKNGPVYTPGNQPLPLEKVRKYGRDIMIGLLHLHEEHLFHRDIKPANCLVDANDVVKIADFGTCSSQMKNECPEGTPAYSCPEQYRGVRVLGEVVDSWAFAMTIYQMSHGVLPVNTETVGSLRASLLSPTPFTFAPNCDPELRDLLAQMLEKDLSRRMLLRAAAHHPFFRMNMNGDYQASAIRTYTRSEGSQTKLYERAMQSVLRGKSLNTCFHGMRVIRKMRRRALKTNVVSGFKGVNANNVVMDPTTGENSNEDDYAPSITHDVDVLQVVSMLLETQKKGQLEIVNLPLRELPPFLADAAPRTSELFLSNNGISSVANIDFSQFQALREVRITNNALTVFPVEILSAPRLQKLDLSNNRITQIPADLGQARVLERLSLEFNCIRRIGTDKAGKSVLSHPCLRQIRLSGNPLAHLPEALHTCPNLELVLDDSPVLMEEWERIVQKAASIVVVWNDIYPRQLCHDLPLFVTSKNMNLLSQTILETLNIRHVVYADTEDWIHPGIITAEEMEQYLQCGCDVAVAATPEKARRSVQAALPQGPESGLGLESATRPRSLAPILRLASYRLLYSSFVVTESPEDEEGGFLPLWNYLSERLKLGERVLVFLDEKKMSRSMRETILAAICDVIRVQSNGGMELEECYRLVLDTMKGLYG